MVYIMGILGFLGGFAAGLMVVSFFLRGRSPEQILNDKALKWKYGLLCWVIAGIGAYAFVEMYKLYFF